MNIRWDKDHAEGSVDASDVGILPDEWPWPEVLSVEGKNFLMHSIERNLDDEVLVVRYVNSIGTTLRVLPTI